MRVDSDPTLRRSEKRPANTRLRRVAGIQADEAPKGPEIVRAGRGSVFMGAGQIDGEAATGDRHKHTRHATARGNAKSAVRFDARGHFRLRAGMSLATGSRSIMEHLHRLSYLAGMESRGLHIEKKICPH